MIRYPAEATIEFNTHGLNGTLNFGEADAEGWMACQVRMRAPGFEANYACNVQRPELELLCDVLMRLMNATGKTEATDEWSLMEMGIWLRLELNRLGHVKGTYQLRSDSAGPSLSGAFEADQSHLRYWLSEVEQALGQPAAR